MDHAGPIGIEQLLAHADFVRGLARSLLFEADADDVAQQTWLAALERGPRHGGNPRGWLAAVVRNLARQWRRGEGRRTGRERSAATPEATASTVELLERESLRRQVVQAVLQLDEPYRSAVIWRYFEELTPVQIAERTGVPAATVRTRLHRSQAQLRAALDSAHDGDRSRWASALLPLAGSGALAGAARAGLGAWPLAVAAVIAVAGGAALWFRGRAGEGDADALDLSVARPPAVSPAPAVPRAGIPAPVPAAGAASAPAAAEAPAGDPAAPGFPRFGRVLHAVSGKPVEGATVTVYGVPGPGLSWSFDAPWGDQSDAQGRFRVKRAWIGRRACAVLPGVGCSQWVDIQESMTALTFRLVPGNTVQGTVRNAVTGDPVADAHVELYLFDGERRESGPSMETDAQGRFRFAGIPAGIAALPNVWGTDELGGPETERGWSVGEPGSPSVIELVRSGRAAKFEGVGGLATIRIGLQPKPGVRVTYRLLLPAGASAPGEVRLAYQRADIDAKGSSGWGIAILKLDPQRPEFEWFMGIGRHRLHVFGAGVEAVVPWREVRAGGPDEHVDLRVRALARIQAQLVGEDGKELPRGGTTLSMMAVWDHDRGRGSVHAQGWGTAVTDANGRADISDALPPIRLDPAGAEAKPSHARGYTLCIVTTPPGKQAGGAPSVRHAGCRVSDASLRRRLEAATPGQPVVLRVLVRTAWPVVCRVVSPSGRPLTGIPVRGVPAGWFEGDATGVSGADGIVRLRYRGRPENERKPVGLAEQMRQRNWPYLEITSDELVGQMHQVGGRDPMAARPGQSVDVDARTGAAITPITAQPARDVTLRFRGRSGDPLANTPVHVQASGSMGSIDVVSNTGSDGRIAVRVPADPPRLQVWVTRLDGVTGVAALQLEAGQAVVEHVLYTVRVDVPIEHVGSLAGRPGLVPGMSYECLDLAGRRCHRSSGTASTEDDEGRPVLLLSGPAETRRFVLTYAGHTRTIDVPDGRSVTVPVWRVGD